MGHFVIAHIRSLAESLFNFSLCLDNLYKIINSEVTKGIPILTAVSGKLYGLKKQGCQEDVPT